MANHPLLLHLRLPSRWLEEDTSSSSIIILMSAASVPCSYFILRLFATSYYSRRPAAGALFLLVLIPIFFFFPPLLLLPRSFPSSPILRLCQASFSWLTLLRLLHISFHHQSPPRPFPSFPIFAASLLCPVRLNSTTSHHSSSSRFLFHFRRFFFSSLSISALLALLSSFPSISPRPIYCLITYFSLSLSHHLFSLLFLLAFRASVFPVFRRPWLASSVSDFWSSRWNLTAHALLHQAIYQPLLRLLWRRRHSENENENEKPPLRARIPAVMFTFLASGLFHEIAYYGITMAHSLSWQVTAFFLLHGTAVSLEIYLRRKRLGSAVLRLPHSLRVLLTLSFVLVTAHALFFCALETSGPFHVLCLEELRTRLSFFAAAIKDLD